MRQIILDTETTGLLVEQGHRLVEVGCLEMINRRITERVFHRYINPKRLVDPGAIKVHGITDEFLKDKPLFTDVAQELFEFIDGAELIIHNAPFDIGFLESEFAAVNKKYVPIAEKCSVIDTLVMARQLHPGQQNSLDALCKRYGIDNTHREWHGALLDAELLAQVYLRMTGGQSQLFSVDQSLASEELVIETKSFKRSLTKKLRVIKANDKELAAHEAFVKKHLNDAV